MTGVTAGGLNIRIIQMGVVETGIPVDALSRRRVVVVIPEAGVTLRAPSDVVRSV
jgi:hypothetical protein